jgi:glycosyltransferase involved in cell wall biosynthesis
VAGDQRRATMPKHAEPGMEGDVLGGRVRLAAYRRSSASPAAVESFASDDSKPLLSIVLPCLNEARTVGSCVEKTRRSLAALEVFSPLEGAKENGDLYEVLVSDNGSSDGSPEVATAAGARVVQCQAQGYGAAIQFGVEHARGQSIIMADADDSYDLEHLEPFALPLINGECDLVMGNRFAGGIARGAMPWKNRYIGNPVLSGMLRVLFGGQIGDAHCGLRGFTREAYHRMNPTQPGMEFASELVVKALLLNLRVLEVPTKLFPDGRDRKPHLRPWRDGWRHARWMLKERIKQRSPRWQCCTTKNR